MSQFDVAAVVEDVVWQMRLGEYPRSINRAHINDLFNGMPPYTPTEAERNNVAVNVNFLEQTRLAHDARGAFSNSVFKPATYFNVTVDAGPKHKRRDYGISITKHLNRILKRSLPYFEKVRSDFANLVLHGIAPSVWEDQYCWLPESFGVDDVLVPSNTKLNFKNLPFFAIFRSYTANQLRKMTTGPHVDPAWNMDMVNRLMETTEKNIMTFGIPLSDVYSPEKMGERFKRDYGIYSSDTVSTIDCWDFYFWNDEDKEAGWNRRIVLDANWMGGVSGFVARGSGKNDIRGLKNSAGSRDEFLYNPGKRKYANKLSEIASWQFADLSAVAPFRYHSVRSLGYLLYAICHLQNKMRCIFAGAALEQMMQYFRVRSLDDTERALKINLVNMGFVDESVQFIPPSERWQLNPVIAQMALGENKRLIDQSAASYSANMDNTSGDTPKTATQVMAEVQATTQLVSAALMQAYEYRRFECMEIARRFAISDSEDPDVKRFRLLCRKDEIPEEAMDYDCWDVQVDRVMGGGNKTLEIAIAEKLMAAKQFYDPEPQRQILRDFTLAITDDPSRATALVPEEPVKITQSVHDAQLSMATLMQGHRLDPITGQNHIEIVETLLESLGAAINKAVQKGMATMEEVTGFQNVMGYIGAHIGIIAQDKNEKQRVKQYGDALGQFGNAVKMLAQRLQEQMQSQQSAGPQMDPKEMAKVESAKMLAQVKAENMRESHAQRTALREVQDKLSMERDAQWHALEMQKQSDLNDIELKKKQLEVESNIQAKDAETAANIRRGSAEAVANAMNHPETT